MKILKKLPFWLSIMSRAIWNQNETQFDKIEIFSFQALKKKDEKIFEQTILSSLQLIKDSSPVQYERLQDQVYSIIQLSKSSEDSYIIENKMCILDNSVQWKEQKLMHIYYAGILVYMSTYGCLLTKTSNFYMEDKIKINDICIQMEKRFYKKVENIYPKYKGLLVKKFLE